MCTFHSFTRSKLKRSSLLRFRIACDRQGLHFAPLNSYITRWTFDYSATNPMAILVTLVLSIGLCSIYLRFHQHKVLVYLLNFHEDLPELYDNSQMVNYIKLFNFTSWVGISNDFGFCMMGSQMSTL